MPSNKWMLAAAAAFGAAGVLCPLCGSAVATAGTQQPVAPARAADTAVAKFHISRMTCGSCPATARLALKKLSGVLSATVTLDDSLGVVRYDPHRVTPTQIAKHLTRLTGFGATILAGSGSR